MKRYAVTFHHCADGGIGCVVLNALDIYGAFEAAMRRGISYSRIVSIIEVPADTSALDDWYASQRRGARGMGGGDPSRGEIEGTG